MSRKEDYTGGNGGPSPNGGGGRRPLIMDCNSRQMLHEIRDNLKHVQHVRKSTDESNGSGEMPQNIQIKPELSQSTPNLLEKPGGNQNYRIRKKYNIDALHKIKETLRPYQNTSDSNSNGSSNSNTLNSDDGDGSVNKEMLQQLIAKGHDEVISFKIIIYPKIFCVTFLRLHKTLVRI